MEAIILAGGLGTRLRSVVADCPKCMAPVAGRPFLEYLLEGLEMQGVTRVVFSVGYLKERVVEYVQGRDWKFSYDFAVEDTPLGTGGGIRLALSHCKEDLVYVLNGDTFFNVDLARLPFAAPVTVALKPMRDFDRYGTVEMSGNLISAFREKAPCKAGLINGGVYAIDRTRLQLSALPESFSFEKEVLEPQAAAGHVAGQVSDAYFIDIGVPEDYERVQQELPELQAVLRASSAVMATHAQTLFLDRDGVLNHLLKGTYVRSWEEFRWMPGMPEAMARWAGKFRHIILVTNQRGVGKGLMTDEDLSRIHAAMMADILEAGGRLDLILVCTAVSDDDPRRKPQPGMFYEARALFPDIDPEGSVMLGDADTDEAFARACGMSFIRI